MDNETIIGFSLLLPYLDNRKCLRLVSTCKGLYSRYHSFFLAKRKEEILKEVSVRISYLYLKNKLGNKRKIFRNNILSNLHIVILNSPCPTKQIMLRGYEMIHGMTILYKTLPSGKLRILGNYRILLDYEIDSAKIVKFSDDFYAYSVPHFLYGNPLIINEFYCSGHITSDTPIFKVIYSCSYPISYEWYKRTTNYSSIYDKNGFNEIINRYGINGLMYDESRKIYNYVP